MKSRRAFLRRAAALPLASALGRLGPVLASAAGAPRVVVVGAGAFGGWTALHLLRRGARVTLLDAWGPGHSRASSGGDTRVIRGTYGADRIYVEMVARSFEIWRESEERWGRQLYRQTGALWMYGDDDRLVVASRPILRELGFPFEEFSPADAQRRWPQVSFQGVRGVHYETRAGYLLARRACEAVMEAFLAGGGDYQQRAVRPGPIAAGRMKSVALSDGSSLEADGYVFACGPWLGTLFPDVLGHLIRATRQEVFFFGTPAGDLLFSEERLPVWVDLSRGVFYGIPGSERRGFKVADDARGAPFDPTAGERVPSAEGIRWAREYVPFRFPGLKGAPLVEARVCQYENSPDSHVIVDRHPGAANAWLVGGGSGHGFKFGPALGERVAEAVLGRRPPDPFFALSRFAR